MASQTLYYLAKRYGKALFAAAGTLPTRQLLCADWVGLHGVIVEDPGGWRTLISPLLSGEQKIQLLAALEKKLSLSPLMGKFLKTIVRRGRLAALPAIMGRFQKEMRAHTGKKRGILATATPMPPVHMQEIEQLLSQKTGFDVILTPQVDPSLLGGAILSWHGFRIDGSLATQLDVLRHHLQKGNEDLWNCAPRKSPPF